MAAALISRYSSLARGLLQRFRDADLATNAAAVSYNAFLALVPLGVAFLGAASFVGGSEDALERVRETLANLAPEDIVRFVTDLLVDAEDRLGGQQGWLIAGAVLLALFFGSRAVATLQKALAHVENRTDRRPGIQLRLVAVALTLGGGFSLLVSSVLLVAGARIFEFLAELSGWSALSAIWAWLSMPVSAAGLYVFLLAFYRWGPPAPLPKSWLAALVGTIGAVASSIAFGLYLQASPSLGATFGVLGAVAIALVWLYLGAFAILLGAVVVAYGLRWQSAGNRS
jgi:membrane protein